MLLHGTTWGQCCPGSEGCPALANLTLMPRPQQLSNSKHASNERRVTPYLQRHVWFCVPQSEVLRLDLLLRLLESEIPHVYMHHEKPGMHADGPLDTTSIRIPVRCRSRKP